MPNTDPNIDWIARYLYSGITPAGRSQFLADLKSGAPRLSQVVASDMDETTLLAVHQTGQPFIHESPDATAGRVILRLKEILAQELADI